MENRTANRLLKLWKCSKLEITFDPDRKAIWHVRGVPVSTGWPHPDMVWNEPFSLGRGTTLAEAMDAATTAAKKLTAPQ